LSGFATVNIAFATAMVSMIDLSLTKPKLQEKQMMVAFQNAEMSA